MLEALVYNRLYEVGYNISFVKDLIICWTTKVTAEAVLRRERSCPLSRKQRTTKVTAEAVLRQIFFHNYIFFLFLTTKVTAEAVLRHHPHR